MFFFLVTAAISVPDTQAPIYPWDSLLPLLTQATINSTSGDNACPPTSSLSPPRSAPPTTTVSELHGACFYLYVRILY